MKENNIERIKFLDGYTSRIKKYQKEIVESFYFIGFNLLEIHDLKLFKVKGYNNIVEYAEKELSYKKSTTYNLMNIVKKFGCNRIENNNNATIKHSKINIDDKYKDYTYGQLKTMLSIPDEDLEKISPKMSVREIEVFKTILKSKNVSDKNTNSDNCFSTRVEKKREIGTENNPIQEQDNKIQDIKEPNNITTVVPEPVEIENKVIQIKNIDDNAVLRKINKDLITQLNLHKEMLKYIDRELFTLDIDKANYLSADIENFLEKDKLPKKLKFYNEVV